MFRTPLALGCLTFAQRAEDRTARASHAYLVPCSLLGFSIPASLKEERAARAVATGRVTTTSSAGDEGQRQSMTALHGKSPGARQRSWRNHLLPRPPRRLHRAVSNVAQIPRCTCVGWEPRLHVPSDYLLACGAVPAGGARQGGSRQLRPLSLFTSGLRPDSTKLEGCVELPRQGSF